MATTTAEVARPTRTAERRFFIGAGIVALFVVFTGFARTYFLKGAFGTPELPALLHVHGLVMTAWFTTFLVQVSLVAAGRTDLHRRVGTAGVGLAALVLVIGTATAINAARLGHVPPGAPPPLVFLAIPLGDMLVFATLVTLGVAYRRRSDFHKRFMTMASLGIITAAVARIPLDALQAGGLPMFFATTDLVILGFVTLDTWRHRRLHPAFGWGLAIVVLSQAARFAAAGTPQWQAFARWLIS